jgi:hypothetical protein
MTQELIGIMSICGLGVDVLWASRWQEARHKRIIRCLLVVIYGQIRRGMFVNAFDKAMIEQAQKLVLED